MKREKSIEAYKEALKYIPGGVNSPVRALRSVGETPLFIESARGATLTDVDGNRFTDFCLSWGVFILGHSFPTVNEAVIKAVERGSSYGIPSLQETELARLVNRFIPGMEQTRFVNSGTEACMSAIRLARGYTNRDIIVKFDGCYHGHVDHLLVSAGSGVANLGNSSSKGVPDGFVAHTISIPFNNPDAVMDVFKKHENDIAAVIIEPIAANMGVIPPKANFLQFLREITEQYGALLIFDEVITGFRVAAGGAQQLFGVKPDLTTVGKIVGGGFPAAAFGGRAYIMSLLAPDGPVYQAGTLSGNPVAMAAGIATLTQLASDGFYEKLNAKSESFISRLRLVAKEKELIINHIGNMFTLFFTERPVESFDDVRRCDQARFARFFRHMLANNIYISPSQFEANFISYAHSEDDLTRFVDIAAKFE